MRDAAADPGGPRIREGGPARQRDAGSGGGAALSGRLSAVSLFDLCQFLMLNRKTGTLEVRSDSGGLQLTFQEGQLMNASDGTLRDAEGVVFRALQWPAGTFEFNPGPVPPERRIEASTENILLESARRIDEMRASGETGDAGEPETTREAAFRETQQRAEALSEAFRTAVGASGAGMFGWKNAAFQLLSSGEAERLLLGSEGDLWALAPDGARHLRNLGSDEAQAWMEEVFPAADRRGSARRAPGPSRRSIPGPDGICLSAFHWSGAHGSRLIVGKAPEAPPTFESLGLPGSDLQALEAQRAPVLLLASAGGKADPRAARAWRAAHLGASGLAAWMSARSATRPEVGLVVESRPVHDWRRLPGRIESVHPSQVSRSGALPELCGALAVEFLAVSGPIPPGLLDDALELAQEGVRVAVVASSRNPEAWARRAGAADRTDPDAAKALLRRFSLIWSLSESSGPGGISVRTRLIALPAQP